MIDKVKKITKKIKEIVDKESKNQFVEPIRPPLYDVDRIKNALKLENPMVVKTINKLEERLAISEAENSKLHELAKDLKKAEEFKRKILITEKMQQDIKDKELESSTQYIEFSKPYLKVISTHMGCNRPFYVKTKQVEEGIPVFDIVEYPYLAGIVLKKEPDSRMIYFTLADEKGNKMDLPIVPFEIFNQAGLTDMLDFGVIGIDVDPTGKMHPKMIQYDQTVHISEVNQEGRKMVSLAMTEFDGLDDFNKSKAYLDLWRKYYNSKAEYRSLLVQTKDLQEERDGYWAIVSAITQKKDIQSAVLSSMTYLASNYGYDAAKHRLSAIESQVKDIAVKKLLTEKQNVESIKPPQDTEIDLGGAVEKLFEGMLPKSNPTEGNNEK